MKKEIILSIIIGLVIFALGAGAGIYWQKNFPGAEVQQAVKMLPATKILNSKVTQSIPIFGQVKKIDGQTLTLAYSGDEILIKISDKAAVYSSIAIKDSITKNLITGAPKQVDFGAIKVGDGVSISVKILDNGQVEGESVFILTSSST